MTDKLHCPFCGAELALAGEKTIIMTCNNGDCDGSGLYGTKEIWQALINGKKAQRQLRTIKDRCVKKVKAKEREISNYLHGISVRGNEIENLSKQLEETQNALKVADNKVKIAKTALSDIKNICERSTVLTYQEKSAIWADAHAALNAMAIASITKQEE